MEITILALSLLSMQSQRYQESHLDVQIAIYFPVVSRLNGMWVPTKLLSLRSCQTPREIAMRAEGGIRTRDLPLTKRLHYLCATTACPYVSFGIATQSKTLIT